MARPREFEQTDVVDRASLAFWRLGYEGCSVTDLVEATNLQRQSLYNVFGDKRGLFLAVLERYRARLEAEFAPLEREDAGLDALRGFMEGVIAAQRKLGIGACLMVVTAFGPRVEDPPIRRAVEGGAAALRACFARLIERAVRSGEVSRGIDPKACAAYLYCVLNGQSALARTGGTPEQLEASLSLALTPLRAGTKRQTREQPTRKRR